MSTHDQTIRQRTPPASASEMSPPLTPEWKPRTMDSVPDSGGETDGVVFKGFGLNKPLKEKKIPSDMFIPDNYVQATLDKQKRLPPITLGNLFQNLNYISCVILLVTPCIAIYGLVTTPLQLKTFIWSVVYYYITGLGITAGYHRLWAHRSYNASPALQYILAAAGAGAVEGSIKWWSRGHRAHHRYTDTNLDPYDAHQGFFYSHIGWMLVKPRMQIGTADVSDLSRNPIIKWQHRWYLYLIVGMGFVVPTLVAGLGWGDWKGGYFFAGAARLCFVHHSTFCVNSLAHWLGESPFDDKHSPRDHVITALCTIGEGYHNFHHQFPMDYRNAIKWYQYDPTKWFIIVCSWFGLASNLKAFPENEIRKGQYTMALKKVVDSSEGIKWPIKSDDLPVVGWEDFRAESEHRPLMVIHGFIHDCTSFAEEHPGGAHLIKRAIGTDATTAFFGGVYDHSNAAHNLLAMMRVGILEGGYEIESLKSDFSTSSLNPDRVLHTTDGTALPSASERAQQTQINSQHERPKAPPGQPSAIMADRFTLSVPPSERLKVSVEVPRLRPGRESRHGKLEGQTRADLTGETDQLVNGVNGAEILVS